MDKLKAILQKLGIELTADQTKITVEQTVDPQKILLKKRLVKVELLLYRLYRFLRGLLASENDCDRVGIRQPDKNENQNTCDEQRQNQLPNALQNKLSHFISLLCKKSGKGASNCLQAPLPL